MMMLNPKIGCYFATLLTLTACGDSQLMSIREQVSTVNISVENEGQKPPVLYTANISARTVFCGGMINGFEQLDNLSTTSGTFTAGFNASAFLQPGENTLDLWVAPIGVYEKDNTYRENDRCELSLFGAFPDGTKEELSSLTSTVIDGKVTSTIYPDKHQTPLINVDGTIQHRLTILNSPQHLVLLNNKHPLVPMSALRSGYRLVLHGLSTEMLHALLMDLKRAQA